ncbi:MAG: hypothetical protein V7771_17125 [Shewanella psychromarinicola]|uniref:hypothetical protein n=1 Tax=Shewanella psychromarinicola TaxID=2487742 RepID=UPI00300251DC
MYSKLNIIDFSAANAPIRGNGEPRQGELVTQLYIGIEIGYLERQHSLKLVNEAKELAKIIGTMIKNKQSNIKEDSPSYQIKIAD